jgi:hypothetical protein
MATNEPLNAIIGEIAARTGNNRALDDVVVEEAAALDHPLHDEFIWDDAVAAGIQRRDHAKKLIKLARIEMTDPVTQRTIRLPSFIRNPLEPPGSFIPMVRLREDRDVAIEVVRREWQRIHSAIDRAEKVSAAIPEMAAMVSVERERIRAFLRRIERMAEPT